MPPAASSSLPADLRRWLVLALVALMATVVAGESSFQAHRLIQYETEGQKFGSTVSSMMLPVADFRGNASLARSVAILTADEATPATLAGVVREQKASGLVIVLPREPSDAQRKSWRLTEQYLVKTLFELPVYLTFADDAAATLALVAEASGTDTITLSASGPSTKVERPESLNLHGTLAGSGGLTAAGTGQPVIIITAYYDAVAAAPSLAKGSDSNGSGTVALLALARLFANAYAGARSQSNYNLLFLLTGAGKLNYAGTREWIDKYAGRTKNVEFVLCLDGIESSATALHLHLASQPAAASPAGLLISSLRSVAAERGITLTVGAKSPVHETGVSAFEFEHERFDRAGFAAATLSARPASGLLGLDTADSMDSAAGSLAALESNIALLAEALGRHVYGLQTLGGAAQLFALGADIDRAHIAAWRSLLAATPRFAPLLGADAPLVSALAADLEASIEEVVRTRVGLAAQLTAYTTAPVTVVAARTKPVYFELLVLVGAGAALLAVKVALSGPRPVIEWVTGLFSRKSKSKRG